MSNYADYELKAMRKALEPILSNKAWSINNLAEMATMLGEECDRRLALPSDEFRKQVFGN